MSVSVFHQQDGTTAPSLRSRWRRRNCQRNHHFEKLVQVAAVQYFHSTWCFGVKTPRVWAVCTFWRADCTLLHQTSRAELLPSPGERLRRAPECPQLCAELVNEGGQKPVRRVLHCSCQHPTRVPLWLLCWIWFLLVYEKELASYRLTFIPKSASTFKAIPELK